MAEYIYWTISTYFSQKYNQFFVWEPQNSNYIILLKVTIEKKDKFRLNKS